MREIRVKQSSLLQGLNPRDGGDHMFGRAVDVSGDRIVVGYPAFCNGVPRLPCAAQLYIYKRDASGTLSKQS